jgi:hypothetical protein
MSVLNEDLKSAFQKIGFTEKHYRFQNLPADRIDPLWETLGKKYKLDEFELGALKNLRCAVPPTGKH